MLFIATTTTTATVASVVVLLLLALPFPSLPVSVPLGLISVTTAMIQRLLLLEIWIAKHLGLLVLEARTRS